MTIFGALFARVRNQQKYWYQPDLSTFGDSSICETKEAWSHDLLRNRGLAVGLDHKQDKKPLGMARSDISIECKCVLVQVCLDVMV